MPQHLINMPAIKKTDSPENGFSLLEVAIALAILGLLLGTLVQPLGSVFQQEKVRRAKSDLETIREALIGFSIAHGRLPCPASVDPNDSANSGAESPEGGGDCDKQHGFVPALTLALQGPRNQDGLLLDPWGNPYRYSVDQSDNGGAGTADFTTQGDIAAVGAENLAPRLEACPIASSSTTQCTPNADRLTDDGVPVIIYSMGRNWANYSSEDELENAGEDDSTMTNDAGLPYPIAGDRIFVSKGIHSVAGDREFDDIVLWLSTYVLYSRLINAGTLP